MAADEDQAVNPGGRERGCDIRYDLVQRAGADADCSSPPGVFVRARARPVPVLGEPWPGIPVRGRNAAGRADACWLPVAPGLTPHGLRHTHKTLMEELATPGKLMHERMGHEDGSVQARYSHVTGAMRRRLLDGLTEVWAAALDARRAMALGSPIAVLDRLLRAGA